MSPALLGDSGAITGVVVLFIGILIIVINYMWQSLRDYLTPCFLLLSSFLTICQCPLPTFCLYSLGVRVVVCIVNSVGISNHVTAGAAFLHNLHT